MNLYIWLPSMFLLGLLAMGIMLPVYEACEKI